MIQHLFGKKALFFHMFSAFSARLASLGAPSSPWEVPARPGSSQLALEFPACPWSTLLALGTPSHS